MAIASCASLSGMALAGDCTRNRRFLTTVGAGSGPKLKPGMTLAIEPMVNMGGSAVRVLADKWTVVTLDGKPSAHFEHTILITKGEPEILTWRKKTLLK